MDQPTPLDLPRRPANGWNPSGLMRAQKEALECALAGESLDEVLNLIVRTAADHTKGRAAIFLVDEAGACLRFSAASGLPDSYTSAVDRFPIGPGSPSCGNAAYTGRRVVVNDVCEDPRWQPFLALAREHGIRACWSTPIWSFEGEVLGTLAIYHATPRIPEIRYVEAIDLLAHTASILIGRARAEQGRQAALELARSNELAAQEMSHRIMNSFQVLQDLVARQARTTQAGEARAALNSVSVRVHAMGTMHRLFSPMVAAATSGLEAAQTLNRDIWKIWGICARHVSPPCDHVHVSPFPSCPYPPSLLPGFCSSSPSPPPADLCSPLTLFSHAGGTPRSSALRSSSWPTTS